MPGLPDVRFASEAQEGLWEGLRRSLAKGSTRLEEGTPLPLVVAAHEWSLLSPLLLKERSDFKAIPQIAVDPYIHQVKAAIAFFRRLSPRGLIADDVGLGKTITAGLIIRELLLRKKIERFLVIAPKLILEQWQEELHAKFGLDSTVLLGASLHDAKRGENVITTYHSAARYMDDLIAAGFDLAVLDEIHKLRNLHTTGPQMAKAVHAAQRKGAFRFALGLSATPLQNSLWDLYSIADILRTPQPNPYGDKGQFVDTYIADPPVGRRIRAQARDEFRRRTSEYMHRTSRGQAQLRFPDRVVGIEAVVASPEEAALQREALGLLFEHEVPALAQISMAQTLLSSPRAALAAIDGRQEGAGAILAPLRDRFAALQTSAKLERLLKLLKEYSQQEPDWRVIVFTIRRATAAFIREALLREGYGDTLAVVMGGQGPANAAAVADFVASPPRRRVLVSTDSGAEGVNLQACNVLVNFDLPWNPMLLEQRIGRIQRLGQRAEKVVVRNLVTKDSVEERVVARLFEKLQLYDTTIGMAEEILGQLQDGDESIEELILDLVAKALKRGDIERTLREQEENAKAAREELERQRSEMDAVLGATEGVGGPTMPEIAPAAPSLTMEEFWRQGMERSGWTLRSRDDGHTLLAERQGRRERRFTFDPNHPGRQEMRLGAPGVELVAQDERPFEEMVTAWRRTGLDATRHHLLGSPEVLGAELASLLDGGQVKAGECLLGKRFGGGQIRSILRINASVFHDQFEKLVRSDSLDVGKAELRRGQDLSEVLRSDRVLRGGVDGARAAALADADLAAFERFYLARREEERGRLERAREESSVSATTAARAAKDIEERFTPVLEATLVAWEGELRESGSLLVDLQLPDGASVMINLPVVAGRRVEDAVASVVGAGRNPSVCHGGHLAALDDVAPCGAPGCTQTVCPRCAEAATCKTCGAHACPAHAQRCSGCAEGICPVHATRLADGRVACETCTGRCAASGATVLAAQLVTCVDTDERVLPEHAVKSAVSGQWIRRARAARSSVSGAFARPEELVTCTLSGKVALPDEVVPLAPSGAPALRELSEQCADSGAWVAQGGLVACSICGKRVVPEHLVPCEASGDLAHPAELERCALSGKLVKPGLLHPSSVSGLRALKALMMPCSVTGELALPGELVRSAVSGRPALPRCLERCSVTGVVVLREELEPSSVSGALALPSALLACEVTGRRALPQELGFCCVSGKRVLHDLLATSARSGRTALREHTGACAVTGKVLLLTEMVPCAVTGRLADPQVMERSALSGAVALPSVMVTTQRSGRKVLPSEAESCAETGRLLAKDEVVTCAYSGARVGEDRVFTSAATGKVGRQSLAQRSDVPPGAQAGPGELVETVTGKHVLPAEAEECPACGRMARLAFDDLQERYSCPSCGQDVCIKDRFLTRCSICDRAFRATPSSAPGSVLLEQAFPRAKEWRRASGAGFEVAIGRPSAWAVLTRPRVVVIRGGQVVLSRETRPGEGA